MAAYLEVSLADDYFETRLHTAPWDGSTPDEKGKALMDATRQINSLNFKGGKTDSSQENAFPRDGDDATPQAILDATCEIAMALLDGRDPEQEFESLVVSSQGFSSVREAKREGDVQPHLAAGIVSVRAWQLLRPYLRDDKAIALKRV